MTIHVSGYTPDRPDVENSNADMRLLFNNIELIQKNEQKIFACSDYFFCELSFAYCSWLLVSGAGPLSLGHLLIGWRQGVLLDTCPSCGGTLLVYRFSCGFPFSGGHRVSGFCTQCADSKTLVRDHGLGPRMEFVSRLRQLFPTEIHEWQEVEGTIFSWGGTGLKPALKRVRVTKYMWSDISLPQLITELETGVIRQSTKPNVSLHRSTAKLELGNTSLSL